MLPIERPSSSVSCQTVPGSAAVTITSMLPSGFRRVALIVYPPRLPTDFQRGLFVHAAPGCPSEDADPVSCATIRTLRIRAEFRRDLGAALPACDSGTR